MTEDTGTVFVVDDDEPVRDSIGLLLDTVDIPHESYGSAQDFLKAYDRSRTGCLVLDIRMPGMSGLELQEKLANMGLHPPIIMISGHGEIPNAVQAVRSGAIDFLQKPVSDQALLDRIQQALRLDTKNRDKFNESQEITGDVVFINFAGSDTELGDEV